MAWINCAPFVPEATSKTVTSFRSPAFSMLYPAVLASSMLASMASEDIMRVLSSPSGLSQNLTHIFFPQNKIPWSSKRTSGPELSSTNLSKKRKQ